jgi:hypothetical protein
MVHFTRVVEIENPRLNRLFCVTWTLYILIFWSLILIFNLYQETRKVGTEMWFRTYVNQVVSTQYEDLKKDLDKGNSTLRICTHPEEFHFWYQSESPNRSVVQSPFQDFRCMPLCEKDRLVPGCMSGHQLVEFPSSSTVHINSFIVDRTEASNSIQQLGYILPWNEDFMGFSFDYGVVLKDESFWGELRTWTDHRSDKDILTVVLDENQKVVKKVEPKASIGFTLQEIFRWAKKPHGTFGMDDGNSFKETNFKPGGSPGPVPRLIGVNIKVKFLCVNWSPQLLQTAWKDGPVCFIQFAMEKPPLMGVQRVAIIDGDGSSLARRQRGVHILLEPGGSFRHIYVLLIFERFIEFMVMAAIPHIVLFQITIHCLGKLSTLYKAAIVQRYDMFEVCKGSAARLMFYTLCYLQMQTPTTQAEEQQGMEWGIQKAVVAQRLFQAIRAREDERTTRRTNSMLRFNAKERIEEALKSSTLKIASALAPDEEEKNSKKDIRHSSMSSLPATFDSQFLEELNAKAAAEAKIDVQADENVLDEKRMEYLALLCYSYHELVTKPKAPLSIGQKIMRFGEGVTHDEFEDPPEGVRIQEFINACSCDEHVAFNDFVNLFDAERPVGILERFFSAKLVDAYINNAKKHIDDEDESVRCFFKSTADDPDMQRLCKVPRTRMDHVLHRMQVCKWKSDNGFPVKSNVIMFDPNAQRKNSKRAGSERHTLEFSLDRSKGGELGFLVESRKLLHEQEETSNLETTGLDIVVHEHVTDGLLQKWNKENTDRMVRTGDALIRVNGYTVDRNEFGHMRTELSRRTFLNLAVEVLKPFSERAVHLKMGTARQKCVTAQQKYEERQAEVMRKQREVEMKQQEKMLLAEKCDWEARTFETLSGLMDLSADELDMFIGRVLGKRVCQNKECKYYISTGTPYVNPAGSDLCLECGFETTKEYDDVQVESKDSAKPARVFKIEEVGQAGEFSPVRRTTDDAEAPEQEENLADHSPATHTVAWMFDDTTFAYVTGSAWSWSDRMTWNDFVHDIETDNADIARPVRVKEYEGDVEIKEYRATSMEELVEQHKGKATREQLERLKLPELLERARALVRATKASIKDIEDAYDAENRREAFIALIIQKEAEKCRAENGELYTHQEFLDFYGNEVGEQKWNEAEAPQRSAHAEKVVDEEETMPALVASTSPALAADEVEPRIISNAIPPSPRTKFQLYKAEFLQALHPLGQPPPNT